MKKITPEDNVSDSWLSWITPKILLFVGVLVGLVTIGFGIWFCFWVKFVDSHELGFIYDRFTGKIEKVEHTGWVVRTPWRCSIHTLDLRPYQVQISANQRILNAKLVRFDPRGLDVFVVWHGRDAGDTIEGLKEILKCYAFDKEDGKDCPFLEVINEVAPAQAPKQALK